MKHLKQLNASNNSIDDINDICGCIENWYYLREASFVGNPITKLHRYREDLIGSSIRLGVNHKHSITLITRKF